MHYLIILFSVFLYHSTVTAATNEVFPGDFDVAKADTQVIAAYYYKRALSGLYANGERVTRGHVDGQAQVLAYTGYFNLQNQLAALTVNLPYVSAKANNGFPDGFGRRFSGLSDLRLSFTLWPVITEKQSLAISGTLIAPTGEYDKTQIINSGDHRYKQVLQLGWVYQFTPTLKLDVVPEISFFGDNHDFVGSKLEQQPSYALTSYLRYVITPYAEAQIGFQANKGGAQTIDGIHQHNPTEANRFYLGASTALSKQFALALRYSQDTSVRNDLKINSDWVLSAYWIY